MGTLDKIKTQLLSGKFEFEKIALDIFQFQANLNPIYKKFIDLLSINPSDIHQLDQIPFLPISFFKHHKILTEESVSSDYTVFKSSGTTNIRSSHYVVDTHLYKNQSLAIFESHFGKLENTVLLALLPNYVEQGDSSLIYMINHFITHCHPESAFINYEFERLHHQIQNLVRRQKNIVVWGVTYALIDFLEKFPQEHSCIKYIFTGGMKGRKKEMDNNLVSAYIKQHSASDLVYSEYGMTELLSQSYSNNHLSFAENDFFKIIIRDPEDPFALSRQINKKGAINIIDLNNLYSCSFIATDDLGYFEDSNTFKLLGRLDNSDIRGCSQLY